MVLLGQSLRIFTFNYHITIGTVSSLGCCYQIRISRALLESVAHETYPARELHVASVESPLRQSPRAAPKSSSTMNPGYPGDGSQGQSSNVSTNPESQIHLSQDDDDTDFSALLEDAVAAFEDQQSTLGLTTFPLYSEGLYGSQVTTTSSVAGSGQYIDNNSFFGMPQDPDPMTDGSSTSQQSQPDNEPHTPLQPTTGLTPPPYVGCTMTDEEVLAYNGKFPPPWTTAPEGFSEESFEPTWSSGEGIEAKYWCPDCEQNMPLRHFRKGSSGKGSFKSLPTCMGCRHKETRATWRDGYKNCSWYKYKQWRGCGRRLEKDHYKYQNGKIFRLRYACIDCTVAINRQRNYTKARSRKQDKKDDKGKGKATEKSPSRSQHRKQGPEGHRAR
ncbi:hypothetical protein F4778DRAFT_783500 [Xylariomycetidae sp. FL2044]|nr:hypothetical protein F4778DRAFT_783500 [Xylariomycetidae sp. FL2044]